ncbi:uncharacterized protein LOC115738240 [Rhodamnia argentea]|uniref:Uncharacterized protein LOC115738240 n=1 Tax=Rhodamnia argentea TaxID=178133 RepID=A0A8B8NVW1_9MYRT|nr:uncharacterized protein LOC115738240 [Rhodamnia argentea]
MAKERRHGNRADRDEFLFSDGGNATDRVAGDGDDVLLFGGHGHENDLYGRDGDSPAMKLYPVSPGSPSQLASSSSSGAIEHPVSKFDTLAGVAIRYGVEVADIRRLNGLTTDIQMFALKSLQIPLPGRHPPSTCLSNGSDTPGRSSFEQTPPRHGHHNLFESFHTLRMKTPQQRVSPAMSSLQGYYGLKSDEKATSEGCEMAVYRKGSSHYLEDGPFTKSLPTSNLPLSRHRKTRSLVNTSLDENGELAKDVALFAEDREGESDRWNDKLIRRRQKSEADFLCESNMPEMLLEDNSGGGFSSTSSKGLALRSKAASRTTVASDAEAGSLNPIPLGLGDSVVVDGLTIVRKSSSTSNLQDQESNGSLSSIWPTSKWSLKPDLQALSTVARARPIFDGLPKPGRRNKTALD